MIEVIGLKKTLTLSDQVLSILTDVNFKIEEGESVAIVGKSGSGKSTLLGILAGLDEATEGQVILANQDLTPLSQDGRAAVRKAHVGFVFQNFQLLPHLSALDNVMLPLEMQFDEAGHQSALEKAKYWLDRVGLTERLHHQPNQLSGGEQQRVAIARAFACEPNILFADEPTGNLDEHTGEHIEDLLFKLNAEQRTTLVLVTHDPELARRCHRQLHLEDGQVHEATDDQKVQPL